MQRGARASPAFGSAHTHFHWLETCLEYAWSGELVVRNGPLGRNIAKQLHDSQGSKGGHYTREHHTFFCRRARKMDLPFPFASPALRSSASLDVDRLCYSATVAVGGLPRSFLSPCPRHVVARGALDRSCQPPDAKTSLMPSTLKTPLRFEILLGQDGHVCTRRVAAGEAVLHCHLAGRPVTFPFILVLAAGDALRK